MHVNVYRPAIHLSLEMKRIKNESPWVLVSHQKPDKQWIEAEWFLWGVYHQESKTVGSKVGLGLGKMKRISFILLRKQATYAIQPQNMTLAGIKWYFWID